MSLHEVCSALRAAGGEILIVTTEKKTPVIYATVTDQKYRFIVPRTGRSTSVSTNAVGFVTHVVTDAASLSWLSTLYNNQPPQADEADYDNLPFGPAYDNLT